MVSIVLYLAVLAVIAAWSALERAKAPKRRRR